MRDADEAYSYYKEIDRIFLADGNALCMKTDDLVEILNYLYDKYKRLVKVSIYGGPIDVHEKSLEELIRLKEAGLKMIYFGLESGSAEVLNKVKKGATPRMMIEAARKVKDSGIKFSSIFILGLGGKELSDDHASETAKVLTGQDPDYAAALTLMLEPGAPIIEEVEAGKMTLLSPEEALVELGKIVEGFQATNCVFRSNHASNYVPIGGTLPEDKQLILDQIEQARKQHEFKPEYFRRL